jgi:hypothetical protein
MTEIGKNKYHGGKIYTLRSHLTDKIYIGSTCQSLSRRKVLHKSAKSNEIAKLDDFYIELLENFKCENKEQLRKREGELIRENKDKCVNIRIDGRTPKESCKNWENNNKEHRKEYKKEWDKEANKEKRKCPNCDGEYHRCSLSRHLKTCPTKII